MPAYFAPDIKCNARPPRDIPEFSRLRPGDKWFACDSSQNGKRGALVVFGRPDSTEMPAQGCSGWVECADGLLYLPGRKMPEQADLVRGHRVDGIDYVTSTGVTLTIPVAAASPRKLLFSSGKTGDPASDWAKRAFDLFDRLRSSERVSATDPAIIALVCDAIGHVYATTPEMLDELGWLTSADLDPILVCMMGADPKKAVQPAGDSLPSPVGA
jgi:hypothetical protein